MPACAASHSSECLHRGPDEFSGRRQVAQSPPRPKRLRQLRAEQSVRRARPGGSATLGAGERVGVLERSSHTPPLTWKKLKAEG